MRSLREVGPCAGVAVHVELQMRRLSGKESMKEVITNWLAICLCQGEGKRQKKATEHGWW